MVSMNAQSEVMRQMIFIDYKLNLRQPSGYMYLYACVYPCGSGGLYSQANFLCTHGTVFQYIDVGIIYDVWWIFCPQFCISMRENYDLFRN